MKNKYFKLILTSIVIEHIFLSFSQKIDLNTCLKMADTTSLAIRNARLDLEINKEQRGSFLSARLPQLNFNADYRYNAKIPGQVVPAAFFGGQPGTYSTVQFGVPFVLSNTLQFSQALFNPQLNYGLEALRINREIVKVQGEMTIQDIRYQVSNTFFLVQALNKQIEFIDSNLLNTNHLLRNMQSMVDEGVVIQTDADKIKINELGLQNTRETLLSSREQLVLLLKILIGFPKDKEVIIETDELVEKTILINNESKNYLALNLVDWQKKMNAEEKKGIKMGYLPNLAFYAAYNYNINLKPEDDFRKGIDGAFIGLRLDWNLFDGLDKYHKYKMNAFNKEKIENQYELLQQQLELNAESNRKQIELKSKSLQLTKEQLILSENVYRNANLKFQQGLISSNDLILADNGLQQAQTNVVSAYIQLRQAELEYLKSIGNIK
jgi:outer membrane protein TolC